MNAERLKTLQNRAEQATKIAEAIQQLTDADPDGKWFSLRLPYSTQNNQDVLGRELFLRVYEAGRLAVLEQLEQELEGWMGGDGDQRPESHGSWVVETPGL